MSKTHRLVRFELLFNFVLPNLVAAKEPAVNKTGSRRPRNVELLLPLLGLVVVVLLVLLLLFLYKGLVEEIDAVSLGEPLGLLKLSAFIDELIISIGRKHWASGLKVVVTSRSAAQLSSDVSVCFCSEYKIFTGPFSPMRKLTSPGSTQTDSSAGKLSKISPIGTPLSRAATSNTISVGSDVFRQRYAEPCWWLKLKLILIMQRNYLRCGHAHLERLVGIPVTLKLILQSFFQLLAKDVHPSTWKFIV